MSCNLKGRPTHRTSWQGPAQEARINRIVKMNAIGPRGDLETLFEWFNGKNIVDSMAGTGSHHADIVTSNHSVSFDRPKKKKYRKNRSEKKSRNKNPLELQFAIHTLHVSILHVLRWFLLTFFWSFLTLFLHLSKWITLFGATIPLTY